MGETVRKHFSKPRRFRRRAHISVAGIMGSSEVVWKVLRKQFCHQILFRSETLHKWCLDNNIPPWPKFLEIHGPQSVRASFQTELFRTFLWSESGRSTFERLCGKTSKRGWGFKNLFRESECFLPSGLTENENKIARFLPANKALLAYDLSHFGFSPIGTVPLFMDHAVECFFRSDKERFLMEITRLLFPQTIGKHPTYDNEGEGNANQCLQQVKRWIAKVEKLIRLVDAM
jgi:hypothetical protein